MSVKGKRRMKSVVEAAIDAKEDIKEITATTFRNDSAAILESLVAELSEGVVTKALKNQGFAADAYLPTLRALASLAKTRRPQRLASQELSEPK
jgi:hypothetical protein